MKKIIIFIIIFLIAFLIGNKYGSSKIDKENIPESANNSITTLYCENGKSIWVSFMNEYVNVSLSDGRNYELPQLASASGSKYGFDDESFVFWNKGNISDIFENNERTFINCKEN